MKLQIFLSVAALLASATGRSVRHVGKPKIAESKLEQRRTERNSIVSPRSANPATVFDNSHLEKRYTRPGKTVIPQNNNTTSMIVSHASCAE